MLVVLVILALVAQTAVLAVDAMVDAERRDFSARALDSARDAILGRERVVDSAGRVWIEGFVNDIGRLPRPDADGKLSELFAKPIGMLGFKEQPVVGSALANASMLCGWRGPYLRLGVGADEWLDGWSRAFVIEHVAEPSSLTISSLGADGILDEVPAPGAAEDLRVRFDENDIYGEFVVDWTPKQGLGDAPQIRIEIWHPKNGDAFANATPWLPIDSPARIYTKDAKIPIGHRTLVVSWRPTSESAATTIMRPITVVPQGLVGGNLLVDMSEP